MRQIGLFDNQVSDLEPLLKAAMNRVAKGCGLSRQQIVDRMNEIATTGGFKLNPSARSLSLEIFEKWVNSAERGYIPGFNALQAFVMATGDDEPLQVLARWHGGEFVKGEDLQILKAALLERQIQALRREKRRIEAGL